MSGAFPLAPVRVLEIELASGPIDVSFREPATGRTYTRALALVRLHGEPLGLVALYPAADGLPAPAVAEAIEQALGPALVARRAMPDRPLASSPPGAPPYVSVVVATRDRPQTLPHCLRALQRLTYPRYEIVVVDSAPGSTATAELVQTLATEGPPMRYLRESAPGQTRAQNAALRIVEGEIVALTDDDTVADPDWLTALVGAFQTDARVGCVTGLVLPYELETPAQLWFEAYGGFGKGFEPRRFDLGAHRPPDRLFPYTAGTLGAGANMAFRTSVLCALGGFDPALGPGSPALGGGDLAAYYDVLRLGLQLVYEPRALVWHRHRRDYAGLRRQVFSWGVGFSAFLTRCLMRDPGVARDLLRELPLAVATTFTLRGRARRRAISGYPPELTELPYPRALRLTELLGMPYGPVAYLRGRLGAGGTRLAARAVYSQTP